jgi:hypothetical protein
MKMTMQINRDQARTAARKIAKATCHLISDKGFWLRAMGCHLLRDKCAGVVGGKFYP